MDMIDNSLPNCNIETRRYFLSISTCKGRPKNTGECASSTKDFHLVPVPLLGINALPGYSPISQDISVFVFIAFPNRWQVGLTMLSAIVILLYWR